MDSAGARGREEERAVPPASPQHLYFEPRPFGLAGRPKRLPCRAWQPVRTARPGSLKFLRLSAAPVRSEQCSHALASHRSPGMLVDGAEATGSVKGSNRPRFAPPGSGSELCRAEDLKDQHVRALDASRRAAAHRAPARDVQQCNSVTRLGGDSDKSPEKETRIGRLG